MKKEYIIPEIELVLLQEQDVITASDDSYDPENILGGSASNWY